MLVGTQTDYCYWLKYDFKDLLRSYNGTNGLLVFKPYPGGFNNIRMSFELAAVIAFIKNRTLVLPPTYRMYLLKGDSNLADFFDLNDIGIKSISFEQFCDREGLGRSWEAVEQKYEVTQIGVHGNSRCFEFNPGDFDVAKLDPNDLLRQMGELIGGSPHQGTVLEKKIAVGRINKFLRDEGTRHKILQHCKGVGGFEWPEEIDPVRREDLKASGAPSLNEAAHLLRQLSPQITPKRRKRNVNTGDVSLNLEKTDPPKEFTKSKRLVHWAEIVNDSNPVIFFSGSLIGNFYQVLYSLRMQQVKKYVARHIHYKKDLFDLAWPFIDRLGDKNYYAMHIRRNDFQYKSVRIPCEDIVRNIDKSVPGGAKLYIATDHKEKEFFKPLEDKYDVYHFNDLKGDKQIDFNLIPIIEQLICTRAVLFIGQDFSTLSTYIYRLRGYMNDIKNKDYYVNTTEYRPDDQLSMLQMPKLGSNWRREHKDAWDFDEPAVVNFRTLASASIAKRLQDLLWHVIRGR